MYKNIRQAVIMVGGKGTRLRPLTYARPKPVLLVADKPCLNYLIDSFIAGGIEEIYLACGYKSQYLVDAIGDGSDRGVKIIYSFEETPLGTGGAIKLLEDKLDDTFVAANGDVFVQMDLKKEIDTHFDNDADVTLSLTEVSNPWEFGTACIDEKGRIYKFMEKPKKEEVISNLINSGTYILNKKILSFVPKNEFFDLSKDLFPILMEKDYKIWGHPLDGVWMDVGRLSDLVKSNVYMAGVLNNKSGKINETDCDGNVYIEESASVSNSVLKNVVVMKNSKVNNCKLEDAIIMPNCDIYGTEITFSVIGENTKIKDSKIKSSLIAFDDNIENKTIENFGGE